GIRAWIEDVVVDEAARGRGIGEALITEAVGLARAAGARTVDLTSRPVRQAAGRLYQRAGFEERNTRGYPYRGPAWTADRRYPAASPRVWSLFMPRSQRSVSVARPAYIRATSGCGKMRKLPAAIPATTVSATSSAVIAVSPRMISAASEVPSSIAVRTPIGHSACTVIPRCA